MALAFAINLLSLFGAIYSFSLFPCAARRGFFLPPRHSTGLSAARREIGDHRSAESAQSKSCHGTERSSGLAVGGRPLRVLGGWLAPGSAHRKLAVGARRSG